MVCPRCGLDRMKPELYTNALSREAGEAEIMVCDQCGTEEAMIEHDGQNAWVSGKYGKLID